MKKITSGTELRNVILQLENRKTLQEQLLKEQFHIAYKRFKLLDFFKSSFTAVFASKEKHNELIDALAKLTADFLSKKIMKESTESELKKQLEKLMQYGITTVIEKNSNSIQIIGECFINSFFINNKNEGA
jgi:predicted transcriptional regulator